MNVDINELGAVRDLAHEGAERSARSLSALTGLETHVEVTDISLVHRSDLVSELNDRSFEGVGVDFDGGLAGQTVLTFDQADAVSFIAEHLPGPALDSRESTEVEGAIEEVGNIMTSGFIDGWADHLGTTIDIEPPRFVRGADGSVLAASGMGPVPAGEQNPEDRHPSNSPSPAEETLLVFESRMELVGKDFGFHMYMLPEAGTFEQILADDDAPKRRQVSVEKLSLFNRMTKQGAEFAAENITQMTDIETTVDVSRLRFVPIETAPAHVGDRQSVGVVFEYHGRPSGYLAILFDHAAATRLLDAIVPGDSPPDEWSAMEQSALKELGNIMTSGFIDGWANVLDTTIDHSPPEFVDDMGSAIMSPIAGRLAANQEYVFIIDSTIRTADRSVGCEIYALPKGDELGQALEDIDYEHREAMTASPDAFF